MSDVFLGTVQNKNKGHVSVMASQLFNHLAISSALCSGLHKINIKSAHYWPFVREIHQSPLTKGQ